RLCAGICIPLSNGKPVKFHVSMRWNKLGAHACRAEFPSVVHQQIIIDVARDDYIITTSTASKCVDRTRSWLRRYPRQRIIDSPYTCPFDFRQRISASTLATELLVGGRLTGRGKSGFFIAFRLILKEVPQSTAYQHGQQQENPQDLWPHR